MSANPWLSGIGFLFGGKIAGAGLKVLGGVFATISKSLVKKGAEALGITEKSATGTSKNPYSVILQEDLTKEIVKAPGGNGEHNSDFIFFRILIGRDEGTAQLFQPTKNWLR